MTKNIFLLLNSNIFSSFLLFFSTEFFTKVSLVNKSYLQFFELKDLGYSFSFYRFNSILLEKLLINSSLYNLFLNINYIEYLEDSEVIEGSDLLKIDSISDVESFIESDDFLSVYY